MKTLSEESRRELDALRAELRRGARRLTESERREEVGRLARLAEAGQLVRSETRQSRFFASRAGRVYHCMVTCPALTVCRDDEIIFIPDPASDSHAERDCERCGSVAGTTLEEIAREARRYHS